jgi:DNA polymerase-1
LKELLFDIGGVDVAIPEWCKTIDCQLATSMDQVKKYVDAAIAAKISAVDIETEGLDSRVYPNKETGRLETVHKIVGFCLCCSESSAIYIPIRHVVGAEHNLPAEEVEAEIQRMWLAGVKFIFHHAKFDCEFLEFMSHPIQVEAPDSFEDTMIANFVLDPNADSQGLKALSESLLGIKQIELSELFDKGEKGRNFSKLNPTHSGIKEYGCGDGYCTYMLWTRKMQVLNEVLDGKPIHPQYLIYRLEKNIVAPLRREERCRILIDTGLLRELRNGAERELAETIKEFETFCLKYLKQGEPMVEISSPKQLAEFLFQRVGVPISEEDLAEDRMGTGAEVLEPLIKKHGDKFPVLKLIPKHRTLAGTIAKYLEPMVRDVDENNEGRIQFAAWKADTGRLSTPKGKSDQGYMGINIHSLPKGASGYEPYSEQVRNAVCAHPGYCLAKIDVKGEELRIATNMSGEPKWIKELNEGSGDLHSLMSIEVFGDASKDHRNNAKTINFGLIYGGGPGVIERTGVEKHESRRIYDKYFQKVPTLKRWIDNQKKIAHSKGAVFSALNRRFPLPEINNPDSYISSGQERKAVNSPIQGTGADIMKMAIYRIDKLMMSRNWYPDIVRCILNEHDEVVMEIKLEYLNEVIPLICDQMTEFSKMLKWVVPLEVDPAVGKSWLAKYDWNKMKSGEMEVPDWLKPYIPVDGQLAGLTVKQVEVKKKETQADPVVPQELKALSAEPSVPAVSNVESGKEVQLLPTPEGKGFSTEEEIIRIESSMKFILTAPLSNQTMHTLKYICLLSQTPSVAPAKTLLYVCNMKGEELIGLNSKVYVDPLKFQILAEMYRL